MVKPQTDINENKSSPREAILKLVDCSESSTHFDQTLIQESKELAYAAGNMSETRQKGK